MNIAHEVLYKIGGTAAQMADAGAFIRMSEKVEPAEKKVRKISYGETLREHFAKVNVQNRRLAGKPALRAL